jgi:hypothetical protein
MISSLPARLVRLLLLLGTLAIGHAQTTVHFYHGGESDGGAANGGALASFTVDSAGSTNLTGQGTAGTYTNATPVPGSTLAYSFAGSGDYSGVVDTSLSNGTSFAMEVWFNTSTLTGAKALFYNGDTGGSGIGLFRDGTHLAVLGGGTIFADGAATLTTGMWYHAALVNDSNSGSLKLYLNGVLDLTTGNGFNFPSTGGLSLGGNFGGGDLFTGMLDEARVFTFAPGTFNTSMLSYSAVPEPSTCAALVGVGALGFAAWRRRRART